MVKWTNEELMQFKYAIEAFENNESQPSGRFVILGTLPKSNPLKRTDICRCGHEYRLCADCQAEDYMSELSRLDDENDGQL